MIVIYSVVVINPKRDVEEKKVSYELAKDRNMSESPYVICTGFPIHVFQVQNQWVIRASTQLYIYLSDVAQVGTRNSKRLNG